MVLSLDVTAEAVEAARDLTSYTAALCGALDQALGEDVTINETREPVRNGRLLGAADCDAGGAVTLQVQEAVWRSVAVFGWLE